MMLVNGDGIADLLVGAPFAAAGSRTGAGLLYVVYGVTGTTRPDVDFLTAMVADTGFMVCICNGVLLVDQWTNRQL